MFPGFGDIEYVNGTENYLRRSATPCNIPTLSSSPTISTTPNSARAPLTTIYPPSTSGQPDGHVQHLVSGAAVTMSALQHLATIRTSVQQWCYGWGAPRYWPAQLRRGLEAAVYDSTVNLWVEEVESHLIAGRHMVDSMYEVMDGDLPSEDWLYRDLWRQSVDVLSTLHEGIACLNTHVALMASY